jgi:hypothetical protein
VSTRADLERIVKAYNIFSNFNDTAIYVGVLINVGFFYFLFSYLQHNQKNFPWMG